MRGLLYAVAGAAVLWWASSAVAQTGPTGATGGTGPEPPVDTVTPWPTGVPTWTATPTPTATRTPTWAPARSSKKWVNSAGVLSIPYETTKTSTNYDPTTGTLRVIGPNGHGVGLQVPSKPPVNTDGTLTVTISSTVWTISPRDNGFEWWVTVPTAIGRRTVTFQLSPINDTYSIVNGDVVGTSGDWRLTAPVVRRADSITERLPFSAAGGQNRVQASIDDRAYPAGAFPYLVDPTISTSWANANYGYRRRIDIDGGVCADSGADCIPSADLSNFPVYVPLKCGTNIDCTKIQSDCDDVVFYDDDQSTALKMEQEGGASACTTTSGQLNNYWVKKPTIDVGTCSGGTRNTEPCAVAADCTGGGSCTGVTGTDGAHFWLYYGYASATDTRDSDNVWAFGGVWHFADGATLSGADATANHNDTTALTATATTGMIGGAAHFDSESSQYGQVAHSTSLDNATAVTMSVWADCRTGTARWTRIMEKGANNELTLRYNAVAANDGKVGIQKPNSEADCYTMTSALCTASETAWHHYSVVSTSTTTSLYVDGAYKGGCEWPLAGTLDHDIFFGKYGGGSIFLSGNLDEARFIKAAQSPSWIKADYDSQRHNCNSGTDPVANSCFLTFTSEEVPPTATPTATGAATETPTHTPTATPTDTPTSSPTITPTATPTVTPTSPFMTVTRTATPTVTPTLPPVTGTPVRPDVRVYPRTGIQVWPRSAAIVPR